MTLTQTAILVKRLITISIIAVVLSTAAFIGYKIWYAYYLASLPPVEEKPDVKFGVLPALNFPASTVSTSNLSYSIDTVTGSLPKVGIDSGFEKIIKVYFVTQTFATFLSPERSQSLAEKFKISTPAVILSETKYKFSDNNKTLLIDLDTGNFSYTKEASVSGQANIDDNNRLIAGFKQTLSGLGVYKTDLQEARSKVIALNPTTARVSLWPADINKKPVLTDDANKSLITGTIAGSAGDIENYLSLEFTYYPIDTSTFATYPTKTAEQAFDDLKNGKGVVMVKPDQPQASITSVYLGYYLERNYSPYLQPVFVFEGPGFVAYVSAISQEFTSYGH